MAIDIIEFIVKNENMLSMSTVFDISIGCSVKLRYLEMLIADLNGTLTKKSYSANFLFATGRNQSQSILSQNDLSKV